jgi:hypothetical protein
MNLRFTKQIIQCWSVVIVGFFDTHVDVAIIFLLSFILHFFRTDPSPWLLVSDALKEKNKAKAYDPKKSVWVPNKVKNLTLRIRI